MNWPVEQKTLDPASHLKQLAECNCQPGSIPASFCSPHSLYSASNSLDVSDPTHVASLHPDFLQASLASHLTKARSTAITNGEYMDFASLLSLSSLLTDTINSQLKSNNLRFSN